VEFVVDAVEVGQIFLEALAVSYQVSLLLLLHIHDCYCSSYAVEDGSALQCLELFTKRHTITIQTT